MSDWCKVGDKVVLLKLTRVEPEEQPQFAQYIGKLLTITDKPDGDYNEAIGETDEGVLFAVTQEEVSFQLLEVEEALAIRNQLNSILKL